MTHFANKRVLITGGSSGIGLALARMLVLEGAHVCIVARGQARIDEAVAELRKLVKSNEQVVFGLPLDIGDPAQIDAVVAPVLERLGGMDVLINNAGITHPAAFIDTPREVAEQIMRINVSGTLDVTRAFLPTMIANGGGQIAIVSSLAGLLGVYGFTAYAASKFALRGFAESLRQELLVHRISITLVFPPDTDTPMLHEENKIKPAETKALSGTVQPISAEIRGCGDIKRTTAATLSRDPGIELAVRRVHGSTDACVDALDHRRSAASVPPAPLDQPRQRQHVLALLAEGGAALGVHDVHHLPEIVVRMPCIGEDLRIELSIEQAIHVRPQIKIIEHPIRPKILLRQHVVRHHEVREHDRHQVPSLSGHASIHHQARIEVEHVASPSDRGFVHAFVVRHEPVDLGAIIRGHERHGDDGSRAYHRAVETESSQSDLPLANTQLVGPRLQFGPEHDLRRRKVEAALFGGSELAPFGHYRLLDHIGEGAMGSVYSAYDEHLERKIAIKLIRASRLDSADLRERTLREARALARLSHPNVVHVYEVGEIQGQLFVAMEFLGGPSLGAWLDVEGRRGWPETLRIFCQAGDGLAAAHAQGIIHRDFKPHNAMFGSDGWVRVLDFGLARFDAPEQSGDAATRLDDPNLDLTISGVVMGTPAYMAPEQITMRQVSAQSDQFSFCVALFEALYGYRPFGGENIGALFEDLTAGRVAARPRDTDVPRWLHAVLLRGLSVDPQARWPSMHELLAALRRDPRVRRRRVATGLLLLAFTSALGFAVAWPDEPAPDVCAGAGEEATEIWGETRAAEVRTLVHERHGTRADELLAIVEPQLDRYATAWSEMRAEACRAHADGQQSSNIFDLRTACLDRRLASLDALVEMLAGASAEQLDGIALAASGLPMLERCADTASLLAELAPPEQAQTRARVQTHREALARALVHEDAGQLQLGLELVAAVLADTEALEYQPLLAEAWLRKGCLEMGADVVEAERSLSQALWTAVAIDHAAVAAEASSKRGYLHGPVLGKHQRALDDLPMLAALNKRVEDDVGLYTEYLNNVGTIHLTADDWPEARRWFEQARDIRVARAHPMDWRGLSTLLNLGAVALWSGRYLDADQIIRDVARESQTVIPSTHDLHIRFAIARSEALEGAGRPRAAIAEIRRCLDNVAGPESPPHLRAYLLEALGRIERDTGDLAKSRDYLNAALALTPVDTLAAWILTSELMLIAALENDASEVETYHQQLAKPLEDQPPAIRARLMGSYGRALHQLGTPREAVATLEKAQSLVIDSTGVSEQSMSASLSYSLGRAYRKLGEHEAAERELLRSHAKFSELYPDADGVMVADILFELGKLEIDRERWDEARVVLEQSISAYLESAESDFKPLLRAREALADLDRARRRTDDDR